MHETTLEIFLGFQCHLHCTFCFQKDLRTKQVESISPQEIFQLLSQKSEKKYERVIFSGGDPFLYPHIFECIARAKKFCFSEIKIHTNALTLASKEVFLKTIECWATWFIFSIHGYSSVHNYLVQDKHAFEKVQKALCNFVSLKKFYPYLTLDTNTVITKQNIENLYVLMKYLSYFPITRKQLVQLYSLDLFSIEERKKMYVSYEEMLPELQKISQLEDFSIFFENIPLCVLPPYLQRYALHNNKYWNEAVGIITQASHETSNIFLSKCKDCDLKNQCSWVPREYIEIFNSFK